MSTLEDRAAARDRRTGPSPRPSPETRVEESTPPSDRRGAYILAIVFGVPIGLVVGVFVALMTGTVMLC